MSHWYRSPRAHSVWSLLRRLERDFVLDECICESAIHILPNKSTPCHKSSGSGGAYYKDIVEGCKRDQCIFVTTNSALKRFLYQQTDKVWGLLLLPKPHNEQIDVLQRLSMGQTRFDSIPKAKFSLDDARLNRGFLIDLSQAPPVFRFCRDKTS
jgi:hypothetical protein